MFQNDESKAIGQAAEDSIVFENPKVEEASSSSRECTKLSGAHEPEGQSIGDHHLHVVDDIDNRTVHPESEGTGEDLNYQVLEQDKRARSVFICPSCNENPVYQRLSMPHYCPHGATDKPKENRVSCYESLSGLGVGPRESVYARPSRSTEEESSAEVGTSVRSLDTYVLSPHSTAGTVPGKTRPFSFCSCSKKCGFFFSQTRKIVFFLSKRKNSVQRFFVKYGATPLSDHPMIRPSHYLTQWPLCSGPNKSSVNHFPL